MTGMLGIHDDSDVPDVKHVDLDLDDLEVRDLYLRLAKALGIPDLVLEAKE